MTDVIRHNKFNISSLNYSKPVNQQKVYYSSMNYNENACFLQSTKLLIHAIKEENKQKYLVLQVLDNDFSFYDLLVSLDDHNLSTTYKSSKEWFQKELPMDVLEGMYRRITNPFKKGETPLIECKLPIVKQKAECSIYDQSNNIIGLDSLTKGSTIVCIFHIKGLKFLKKDYYCEHVISQIKICDAPEYIYPTGCLIDIDADNEPIHEFEFIDEDVIMKNNELVLLEEKYTHLEQELHEIKQKIDSLK